MNTTGWILENDRDRKSYKSIDIASFLFQAVSGITEAFSIQITSE